MKHYKIREKKVFSLTFKTYVMKFRQNNNLKKCEI